jgi:hypothetical protein
VTEDTVLVIRVTDGNESVAEGLSGNDVLGHDIKVKESWLVDIGLRDDTSRRTLVDDSRSYTYQLSSVNESFSIRVIFIMQIDKGVIRSPRRTLLR